MEKELIIKMLRGEVKEYEGNVKEEEYEMLDIFVDNFIKELNKKEEK